MTNYLKLLTLFTFVSWTTYATAQGPYQNSFPPGADEALNEPQPSQVTINGQVLDIKQLIALQQTLGTIIAPGNYAVDYNSGCWLNMTTGASGCIGNNTTTVHSRYGSGERSSNGSWSHYSRAAGMGVGGTADGCVYAGSWSNC